MLWKYGRKSFNVRVCLSKIPAAFSFEDCKIHDVENVNHLRLHVSNLVCLKMTEKLIERNDKFGESWLVSRWDNICVNFFYCSPAEPKTHFEKWAWEITFHFMRVPVSSTSTKNASRNPAAEPRGAFSLSITFYDTAWSRIGKQLVFERRTQLRYLEIGRSWLGSSNIEEEPREVFPKLVHLPETKGCWIFSASPT